MRKHTAILLLILLSLPLFVSLNGAHAVTNVSGLITANTTWSKSGSPYQFTGPVAVKEGVTLTIEPDTTVDFGLYYMQVNGTLHAVGQPQNRINIITREQPQVNTLQQIQFMPSSKSWDNKTGLGCILENIAFDKVSVICKGSSPRIANNFFDGPFWMAVYAPNGSPQIIGNNITNCLIQGLSTSDAAIISDNYVSGSGSIGIYAYGNTIVSNNKVTEFASGIKGSDHAVIEGNVVENCGELGISGSSRSVTIKNNFVANNQIGITVAGDIQNNVITKNVIGLQISGQSTITNNNIFGNTQNSLALNSQINIDASSNYWGTTDEQAIEQSIWDSKNDFNLGEVTFKPFLTHSVPDLPTGDFVPSTGSWDNFYLTYELKTDILLFAQVVAVVIGAVWVVLGVVLIRRRAKKRSRKLQN